jgi:hypothetical protein
LLSFIYGATQKNLRNIFGFFVPTDQDSPTRPDHESGAEIVDAAPSALDNPPHLYALPNGQSGISSSRLDRGYSLAPFTPFADQARHCAATELNFLSQLGFLD